MNNRRKFFAALACLPAALIPSPRKPEPKTLEVRLKLAPINPEEITEMIRRNKQGISEEIIKQIEARQGAVVSR